VQEVHSFQIYAPEAHITPSTWLGMREERRRRVKREREDRWFDILDKF